MKKWIIGPLLLAAVSFAAAGCGGGSKDSSSRTYNDGEYEGQSSVFENDDGTEDGNGYGVVNLTIKDGKISECTYQTYEIDGTLKDEEYGKNGGKIVNKNFYKKAQFAVKACGEYASLLVEKGDLSQVDAISGATISYNEFVEATEEALAKAEKK